MLSQNNAHPSSSKSMMPYDDDTLLAIDHYIMKFPASQDETPKRLRLHSVFFFTSPVQAGAVRSSVPSVDATQAATTRSPVALVAV